MGNNGDKTAGEEKARSDEILGMTGEETEIAGEEEREEEAEFKMPSSSDSTPEGKIRFFVDGADDEKKPASLTVTEVYHMEATTSKEVSGQEEQPSPLLIEKRELPQSGEAVILRDLKIAAATSADVTAEAATDSVNPTAQGNPTGAALDDDPMASFLVTNTSNRAGGGDPEVAELALLNESSVPDPRRVPGALRVIGNGGGPAPARSPPQETAPREAHPDTAASRDELLLNARLVEEDEEAGRGQQPPGILVEAKPALEGFAAIVRNHRFKYVAGGFLLILLGVVVPLAVILPKRGGDEVIVILGKAATCGSDKVKQSDYRGNISITEGNITCQRWDQHEPHSHNFFFEDYPAFGLQENYCRNPDGESRAWCYTSDPNSRWQYCNVPYCQEMEVVLNNHCGTLEQRQEDYRGTMAITATGKKCQRWDTQAPHSHSNSPEQKPSSGLEENYCRNPDGEPYAWCYTEDEDTRWELCDVPLCGTNSLENSNETCSNCTKHQCGSARRDQADYRGNLTTTQSGRTCQRWDSQEPHGHMYDPEMYPESALEENYCRNPSPGSGREHRAWCLTTDPNKRFDHCEVPFCENDFVPRRTCGTASNQQSDYRGDIAVSETGRDCWSWSIAAEAIANGHTPQDLPEDGLIGNYCRNPGNLQPRSWCYVSGATTSWEFCDVPDCQECGTPSRQKQDYRGTLSTTVNGATCLRWEDKETAFSNNTLLEENYCRNPDGQRNTVWCYIDPESSNWGYCDVPDCPEEEVKQLSPGNTTCGSHAFRQSDYRGRINQTVSGRPCQPWSSQLPHAHKYSPEQHPTAGLDENYCRQPDSSEFLAWCFVDDDTSGVRWEHCGIPMCEELSVEEPDCGTKSLKQRDYSGNVSSTSSGWTCQEWALQSPHEHRFSPERNPDLEGNACRNPDGSDRAWCFTTNPDVIWEYCDIPVC